MRTRKVLFCAMITIVFVACTEQSPEEYYKVAGRSKTYFDEDQQKKGSKDFVFPDSVMIQPLIATYYEEDPGAHSVMFYTDTLRKFGKVIRYFPDKSVLVDDIKSCGYNQFVSVVRPELRYMMDNDRIICSCWRGDDRGIAYSFEHLRTDGNRQ